jgi:hypothetical protein
MAFPTHLRPGVTEVLPRAALESRLLLALGVESRAVLTKLAAISTVDLVAVSDYTVAVATS